MLLAVIPSVRLFDERAWLERHCDVPNVLDRLLNRTALAYRIKGTDAGVILSVAQTVDTGKIALWVVSLFGRVGLRPKANMEMMRRVLEEVAVMAADAGCDEVRVEQGTRADWKLRLLPKLGFERLDVGQVFVMRKAIK